ncbi:LapA family protein [Pseudomonas yamanorum]
MRGVKRVAVVLMVLIVALVVVAFVLENQQNVSLSFLGFSTGQAPASVFIVVAFIVGMLVGPLLGALFLHRRHKAVAEGRI